MEIATRHLSLSISENSGIPLEVPSRAIDEVDHEFTRDYRVSLIADQQNNLWELKLAGADGRTRRDSLELNQQNVRGVMQVLRWIKDTEE
jgi:hypothetical protein